MVGFGSSLARTWAASHAVFPSPSEPWPRPNHPDVHAPRHVCTKVEACHLFPWSWKYSHYTKVFHFETLSLIHLQHLYSLSAVGDCHLKVYQTHLRLSSDPYPCCVVNQRRKQPALFSIQTSILSRFSRAAKEKKEKNEAKLRSAHTFSNFCHDILKHISLTNFAVTSSIYTPTSDPKQHPHRLFVSLTQLNSEQASTTSQTCSATLSSSSSSSFSSSSSPQSLTASTTCKRAWPSAAQRPPSQT